ncbi:MAG: transglycosylase SLT domain-containing protein, partial [Pseudomonadota bacterium]
MIFSQKDSVSSGISGLINRAGEKIADAIKTASTKTGVDFTYLMKQAQVESSFKTNAKSSSSSASGLYQFVESTWLRTVNKYGDKHGLGDIADQISDNGKVASNTIRNKILALRNNPEICSLMAGELAAENKSYLESCTQSNVGSTELYMAHFLGAAGAAKFINAADKNGNEEAAKLFPAAASANKNIFYKPDGKARSLDEVHALFNKKFEIPTAPTAYTTTTTVANNEKEATKIHSIAISTKTAEPIMT